MLKESICAACNARRCVMMNYRPCKEGPAKQYFAIGIACLLVVKQQVNPFANLARRDVFLIRLWSASWDASLVCKRFGEISSRIAAEISCISQAASAATLHIC